MRDLEGVEMATVWDGMHGVGLTQLLQEVHDRSAPRLLPPASLAITAPYYLCEECQQGQFHTDLILGRRMDRVCLVRCAGCWLWSAVKALIATQLGLPLAVGILSERVLEAPQIGGIYG